MTNNKKVKINIDKLLKDSGMNQSDFADKVGIRQAAISQLSRGFVSRISIDHIEKIATALNIDDINDIITLVDDE